ncbi:TPA: hypothetical protein O4G42_004686, partial [Vibrio alginolyticus]|nr:hypothetical protein [Vibrio alginolyticus]
MYLRIKAITFLIVLLHANFTMATNNYDYNQKNDFLLLDNGNENLLVPPLDIKSKIDTFLEDHKNTTYDIWENNPLSPLPYEPKDCNKNNIKRCLEEMQGIIIDERGVYGLRNRGFVNVKYSDFFFNILKRIEVGKTLYSKVNICSSTFDYDVIKGERCQDYINSNRNQIKQDYRKIGHLNLNQSNKITNLMVDSSGFPIIFNKNSGCEFSIINGKKGVICELLSYELKMLSSDNINMYFNIMLPNKMHIKSNLDLQKSVNKVTWISHEKDMALPEMKEGNKVYIFISSDLLQQFVLNDDVDDIYESILLSFYYKENEELYTYNFHTKNKLYLRAKDYLIEIKEQEKNNKNKVVSYDITKTSFVNSLDIELNFKQNNFDNGEEKRCAFHAEFSEFNQPDAFFPFYVSFKKSDKLLHQEELECNGNETVTINDGYKNY